MEKVQLILQLLHPYTFIPTSTVIREMRVNLLNAYKLIEMDRNINENKDGKSFEGNK